MAPGAQHPPIERIREMLELALAGLDHHGLEQAALHVSLALQVLSTDPAD